MNIKQCPQCRRGTLLWKAQDSLYECLNTRCARIFTEDELSSIRNGFLRKTTLFISLIVAGIGVIVYILLNSSRIDFVVASVISTAAALAILWNASTFRTLWVNKLRSIPSALVVFSLLFIVLIWSTAAAYTGIAPFSYARDALSQKLANPVPESYTEQDSTLKIIPSPSPTAIQNTPTPTPAIVPTPAPAPMPTPLATPTATPLPEAIAYWELEKKYVEAGNCTIPLSLDKFVLLAQAMGIQGAVQYVASGRWDPVAPLH